MPEAAQVRVCGPNPVTVAGLVPAGKVQLKVAPGHETPVKVAVTCWPAQDGFGFRVKVDVGLGLTVTGIVSAGPGQPLSTGLIV